MKRIRTRRFGLTLMEAVIATSIMSVVMGSAITLYVAGTRGFYSEASETYVQYRVRTVLDRMATDSRAAKAILPRASYNGVTYTANSGNGGSSKACLIMLVPSQDANGFFYYGSHTPAGAAYPEPNTLAMDLMIYYATNGRKVCRTVVPHARVSTNGAVTTFPSVRTADGTVRTSYRPLEVGGVTSQDMETFKLVFKDKDGRELTQVNEMVKGAAVDLTAKVSQTANRLTQSELSVTGIRLRNMRSASIYGNISPARANTQVQAIFTGYSGAYQYGTVVGNAVTDATGYYEVFGLVGGSYQLKFVSDTGAVTWGADANIPVEDEKGTNVGTTPAAY